MYTYGNMYLINSYSFGGGAPAVDPDAQAFITAASITDPTQQSAIDTLVTDLKGYGVWTKMKAVYPFVGGTASTHKFNLKDPRDLDAAFRLVFNGGGTHSSNGYQPNGTNAYANTYLIASDVLSNYNVHYSYYSRTSAATNINVEMGCLTTSPTSYLFMHIKYLGNVFYGLLQQNTLDSVSNTSSLGFFNPNRTANNVKTHFKNGTNLGTSTAITTSLLPIGNSVLIGALNNNFSVANYTTKQCAFASIGDGLTDTEAADFYTAVQAFNTTLSRQV